MFRRWVGRKETIVEMKEEGFVCTYIADSGLDVIGLASPTLAMIAMLRSVFLFCTVNASTCGRIEGKDGGRKEEEINSKHFENEH